MASPREFAQRVNRIAAAMGENIPDIIRRTALVIDQAVVLATPVDTGRARSNWQVSVDSVITDVREPYAPGENNSTGSANAQAAIEQGRAAIASFTERNHEIHIANNLPYIGRLNDGWSAQAPENFVERAIQNGVDYARSRRVLPE